MGSSNKILKLCCKLFCEITVEVRLKRLISTARLISTVSGWNAVEDFSAVFQPLQPHFNRARKFLTFAILFDRVLTNERMESKRRNHTRTQSSEVPRNGLEYDVQWGTASILLKHLPLCPAIYIKGWKGDHSKAKSAFGRALISNTKKSNKQAAAGSEGHSARKWRKGSHAGTAWEISTL